jgi:hypothetical protein
MASLVLTVTDMLTVNMGRIGEDLGQVGPLESGLVIGRIRNW